MIKLAIAVEKERLATHYAHAERYDIYQIENGKYHLEKSLPHDKSNHLQSYDDLAKNQVNAIAFDMIGDNGFEHLMGRGMEVYYGQKGEIFPFIQAFIQGTIQKPKVYVEDQSVCAL
jgi:predicted Fe-Mo cluster-binding NifX family protein